MLAVRLVGFRFKFVFDSPDLRSELLPCFTRDAYKLGRGTRWLELITVERIAILAGYVTVHELGVWRLLDSPHGSLCYKGSVDYMESLAWNAVMLMTGKLGLVSLTFNLTDYDAVL